MMRQSYLQSVFDLEGHYLFDDQSADQVTAAQARSFMMTWMNGEPQSATIARKFWHPLDNDQKNAILLKAFPDGQTYSRPDV